jgi:spore coat polysaccharide biosynthesis protein SpsF
MKVGYLITARLKSTRLPEKLLREVEGRPILSHMIDRLKTAQRVDQIIVCTSTQPQDDRLVDLATAEGVSYFRGDEEDVLKRLYSASVAFELDYILNITGDCPLVDPMYADRIVKAYEDNHADLIRALDLPHGAYSYGIKPSALKKVIDIKDDNHTEVWGRYFTDTDLFQVYDLPIVNLFHRQPTLRMTLDYPEDLEFFRAVFAVLYQPGKVFSLDEILSFLDSHPEVVAINKHCAVRFMKRWRAQSDIRLKPRYGVRRVAVIGVGSIGQRHIKNLHTLGITDIVALRSRKGHFVDLDPALRIREVSDWQELVDAEPDVAILSNPTSLHLDVARRLLPHIRGLFIEKPLSHTLDGVAEFLAEVKKHRTITFVGYNLRFHPLILEMQRILGDVQIGAPLVFQCQVGQWLPDWHPYENYLQGYYARKDLGGGVSLTLIHEVDLAVSLFGPVEGVFCLTNASQLLPLDVDVVSDIMLQHKSGTVSQIHLDFLQRPSNRQGTISCERGWLRYDLIHPRITAYTDVKDKPQVDWEPVNFNPNDHYVDEMKAFLEVVQEGRYRNKHDVWNGAQGLAVVIAAQRSANEKRYTLISEEIK